MNQERLNGHCLDFDFDSIDKLPNQRIILIMNKWSNN